MTKMIIFVDEKTNLERQNFFEKNGDLNIVKSESIEVIVDCLKI